MDEGRELAVCDLGCLHVAAPAECAGFAGNEWQQPLDAWLLCQAVDEVRVADMHFIAKALKVIVHQHARDRIHIAQGHPGGQVGEFRDHILFRADEGIAAFTPDSYPTYRFVNVARELPRDSDNVGVIGTRQSAITGDQQYRDRANPVALGEQWVSRTFAASASNIG